MWPSYDLEAAHLERQAPTLNFAALGSGFSVLALYLGLSALAGISNASPAQNTIRAGVEIDSDGEIAATLGIDTGYAAERGNDRFEFEAKGAFKETRWHALEDFKGTTEAAFTHNFTPALSGSIEASLTHDRDDDPDFSPLFGAIDSEDTAVLNFVLEYTDESFGMRLDAGATAVVQEDLRRHGLAPFDRNDRSYIDPEMAFSVAFGPQRPMHAFVELAYVGRRYFEDKDFLHRRRHYDGLDLIGGLEFDRTDLKGYVAGMVSVRAHSQGGTRLLAGPFVDITWTPDEQNEIVFALAAQLMQDESGPVLSHPDIASHLQWTHKLHSNVSLIATLDSEYEDFYDLPAVLTLTPSVELAWQQSARLGWYVRLEAEWEQRGSADTSAVAAAGVKVSF